MSLVVNDFPQQPGKPDMSPMDDQLLDLLAQWEEATARGEQPDLETLAGGNQRLLRELKRQIAALQKIGCVDRGQASAEELHLPSLPALRSSLLTPANLSLEKLREQLTSADLVSNEKVDELFNTYRIKTAHQLAGLLLEKELLTRFQIRSISQGKTRGLKLGRYLILEKIGEGGMGQVYKARHNKMGREVALKILPRAAMSKADAIERFNQEVQVAAQLRHANIVTAYDADEAEGLHFFAMEYVAGRDLNSMVRKAGPLSVASAVDYVMQAAQGLQYAHGVGLVHRDIKPANLLLDNEGVIKILDMGIARIHTDDQAEGLTHNGAIMGTVDFMAPEQAVDTKTVTPKADLYSLGCTLYFLLTGKPPYDGDTLLLKLLGHREQSPPPLVAHRHDVPPALEAIYQKCLAKLPDQRYASARDLIADLQQVRPQLSDAAPPRSLDQSESSSDTSPTNFIKTQASIGASNLPSLITIEPRSQAARRIRSGRGASFYGGVICVGLLLCGLLSYGVGMLFKISTPHGDLVVEVEGKDFAAHLHDQLLTLVNQQTGDQTMIELSSIEQSKSLPAGPYKFALETSSGLRTNVSELTISSGVESKVRVYWETKPTPPPSKSDVLLSQVTAGPWTPLFNDKDFTGWELRHSASIKWSISDQSVRGANSGYRPGQGGSLFTQRSDYEDFHFRCEILAGQRGETWVQFRHDTTWENGARRGYSIPNPDPEKLATASEWGIGSLYEDVFQVGQQRVKAASLPTPKIQAGDWYKLEIIALGESIQILVNGQTTVEYQAVDAPARRGSFGFGCPILSNLAVRNVEVRELTSAK